LWIRLAFLAVLGLAAGSFLGFPIASLLCILIYIVAWASSYLSQSLRYYTALGTSTATGPQAIWLYIQSLLASIIHGEIGDTVKLIAMGISSIFQKLVPSFGETSPAPLLADGRLIGWSMIGQALLWVGVVWTGCAAIA